MRTREDVVRELGDWVWVDEHSEEVLEGLAKIDARYEKARQMEEEEKQRKKAEEVAERQRLAEEKRRLAEEKKVEEKRQKAEKREEEKRRKAKEKEEEKQRKAVEREIEKKRKAEETKKRKAEDRLRKREADKRKKEMEKEEKERASAEENRWQTEDDMWWQADAGVDEMEKRRRVGYDAFIEVPTFVEVPSPVPPRPPRPRPTKILPPTISDAPLDNGSASAWPAAIAPMDSSLLPVQPPPYMTPHRHPQPHMMRPLPPTSGQQNCPMPLLNTPSDDGFMPARYPTPALPITISPLTPVYSHPRTIHPPPSGFAVASPMTLNIPYPSGYPQRFDRLPSLGTHYDHLSSASYVPTSPHYNGFRDTRSYFCELPHIPFTPSH